VTPRGLTLVELLVVLVLVGLAASTVSVQLLGTTTEARLHAAQTRVDQAFRLARSQAALRHRPVWVCFELGGSRIGVSNNPESVPWQSLDSVTIVRGAFAEEPVSSSDLLRVRVGPTGMTFPWAVELESSSARRTIWSDGGPGALHAGHGVQIEELRWQDGDCACAPGPSH
jgi:prepilin-type N-terminal cleavage/methylation domain-containing protein